MNIILIGFMGTGKTAVGQMLAADLGLSYVDCDELIEKMAKQTVSEIFAKHGETYFRNFETEVAKSLTDYDGFVISTGGGMVLRPENVVLLKQAGPLVLLWAQPEIIYQRVKEEKHRPLLNVADPLGEIKKILFIRQPVYEKAADYEVDTSKLSVEKVVEEIKQWLKLKSN